MIRFLPLVLGFVLWLYCLVDCIGTRDDRVRHLPKVAWIIIVLLFPFVGSLAWLLAGRPAKEAPLTREQGAAPGFSEYERRGRFAAADPEKDAEFLRQVRERAEQQRRAYDEKKRLEREAQEQPREPEA
ncbi:MULTISPECIES: PLD nuclease N-terminal domain-containing protein [unclassified Nocardioides]|uniref:PLD nuclease N-terminal domain-containing protein n=1 Tax=unclassified Nocardioides TaxID=2615069 RepID=UPI00301436C5